MLSINNSQEQRELYIANQLYKNGFLPGLGKCECGDECFNIKKIIQTLYQESIFNAQTINAEENFPLE